MLKSTLNKLVYNYPLEKKSHVKVAWIAVLNLSGGRLAAGLLEVEQILERQIKEKENF